MKKNSDIKFIPTNTGFSTAHVHTFYFNSLGLPEDCFSLTMISVPAVSGNYFSSYFVHAIFVVISSVVLFWFSRVSYAQVQAIWFKKKYIITIFKNSSLFIKPNHLTSLKQPQFVSFSSCLGDILFSSCSVANVYICQDSLFELKWLHKAFHSFPKPAKDQ